MYMGYAYDAVYTWAHALQACITAGQDPVAQGTAMSTYLRGVSFTGKTGTITLDTVGDRSVNVSVTHTLQNIRAGGTTVSVGTINGSSAALNTSGIMAYDGSFTVPSGVPSIIKVAVLYPEDSGTAPNTQAVLQYVLNQSNANASITPGSSLELVFRLLDNSGVAHAKDYLVQNATQIMADSCMEGEPLVAAFMTQWSGWTMHVLPTIQSQGFPVVNFYSTNAMLSGQEGFFRTVSSDSLTAEVAADWVVSMGFNRLMTVATGSAAGGVDPYGEDGSRSVKSVLQQRSTVKYGTSDHYQVCMWGGDALSFVVTCSARTRLSQVKFMRLHACKSIPCFFAPTSHTPGQPQVVLQVFIPLGKNSNTAASLATQLDQIAASGATVVVVYDMYAGGGNLMTLVGNHTDSEGNNLHLAGKRTLREGMLWFLAGDTPELAVHHPHPLPAVWWCFICCLSSL